MNLSGLLSSLPPQVRKILYAALVVGALVVAVLQITGIDVGKAPDVITYLSGIIGAVAVGNVPSTPPALKDEVGSTDVSLPTDLSDLN